MSSLREIADGLAAALAPLEAELENLQVHGRMNLNPTPPSIDIYPGDPFQNGSGFGPGHKTLYFTVRARVLSADHDAGQDVLLDLLDEGGPASVEAALTDDQTLGGLVHSLGVADEGTAGFRVYSDPGGDGQYLGCEWRVEVLT